MGSRSEINKAPPQTDNWPWDIYLRGTHHASCANRSVSQFETSLSNDQRCRRPHHFNARTLSNRTTVEPYSTSGSRRGETWLPWSVESDTKASANVLEEVEFRILGTTTTAPKMAQNSTSTYYRRPGLSKRWASPTIKMIFRPDNCYTPRRGQFNSSWHPQNWKW